MEDPNIFVRIDYSEKSDVLLLDLKYAGEHYDPNESDNIMYKAILAEPTTTLVDEVVDNPEKWYNNHTSLSFRWED